MKGRSDSSLRRCCSRGPQHALQLAKEALTCPCSLYVGHRAREKDFCFAFEDVERRRTEFAFAANNFASAIVALYDSFLIQFEEGAGYVLEDGQMQEFRGIENVALPQFSSDNSFVGESPGWARDHAFAARNADDSAIGRFVSKAIPAWYPLPRRASTQLWRMSSQPRMQRSQRMHDS